MTECKIGFFARFSHIPSPQTVTAIIDGRNYPVKRCKGFEPIPGIVGGKVKAPFRNAERGEIPSESVSGARHCRSKKSGRHTKHVTRSPALSHGGEELYVSSFSQDGAPLEQLLLRKLAWETFVR